MSETPFPPRCASTFKHERPLAEGAFGAVHLATQISLHRRVAVKLLHREELRDADSVQRFLDEAKVTAGLSHPSIVTLIDHDVEDGVPWIAYEFLPGRNLDVVLATGRLPWGTVARIGAQVAGALHSAHERGVLHRDVKPSNIMEAGDALWKITDFGIARWTGSARVKTQTGEVIGTLAYIAPEQMHGNPATPASDVFSLGVVLHELATGAHPYEGHVLRLISRDGELPPVSSVVPVPPEVDEAIGRAVRRDPAQRFASAGEMAAAFEAIVAREASLAVRTKRATHRSRPVSSGALVTQEVAGGRAWVAPAAGALALVALAGAGVALRQQAPPEVLVSAPVTSPTAAAPAGALPPGLLARIDGEWTRLTARHKVREPWGEKLNALMMKSMADELAQVRPLAEQLAADVRADIPAYEALDRDVRAAIGETGPATLSDGLVLARVASAVAVEHFRASRFEQIRGIADRFLRAGEDNMFSSGAFVMQFGQIALDRRCIAPARRWLEAIVLVTPRLAAEGVDGEANALVYQLREVCGWTSSLGWQADARTEWSLHASAFHQKMERQDESGRSPVAATFRTAAEFVWSGRPSTGPKLDDYTRAVARLEKSKPSWTLTLANVRSLLRSDPPTR
jgi:tRNA A-37 threonylcarbamoyl transferase component Bud32